MSTVIGILMAHALLDICGSKPYDPNDVNKMTMNEVTQLRKYAQCEAHVIACNETQKTDPSTTWYVDCLNRALKP